MIQYTVRCKYSGTPVFIAHAVVRPHAGEVLVWDSSNYSTVPGTIPVVSSMMSSRTTDMIASRLNLNKSLPSQ